MTTDALPGPVEPAEAGTPDHLAIIMILPVDVPNPIRCPTCHHTIQRNTPANYWADGHIRHTTCKP